MKKVAALVGIVVILLFVYVWYSPDQQSTPESSKEDLQEKVVRKAAVAGRFYPSSAQELQNTVNAFLDQAPSLNLGKIRGLVCPHAGYIYSGLTASYSYSQLTDQYDTVILLGPTHYVPFRGASIPECTHYETPLGLVKVSEKAEDLKKESIFSTVPEAHTSEHCLEVQLPFLQTVLTDFEIVPIVLGEVDSHTVASALSPYIDEKTLVIASSDLSHYYPYEKACELDMQCTDAVPSLDFDKLRLCEACGIKALQVLMYLAEEKGWQGELLDYRNSGDTAGEKSRVVGYMAAAFYGGESDLNELNDEEQQFLLQLARKTLEQFLQEGTLPEVDQSGLSDILKEERACFVTLNKQGMLRGCIGNLAPEGPLYKAVMANAVNAALKDPRFPPVRYEELSEITIEISVLTIPEKISYQSTADLMQIIQGKGVTISTGSRRATYLPQVWEQLPDPAEFLSRLCMKAGLPSDFWKEGSLNIYVYTAEVFSE